MTLLWLDDIRDPNDSVWKNWINKQINNEEIDNLIWIFGFEGFVSYINQFGLPDIICFDHDLGSKQNGELYPSGYDCVRWLVDYCIDRSIPTPICFYQTSNIVGKENMESLINNYNNSLENSNDNLLKDYFKVRNILSF